MVRLKNPSDDIDNDDDDVCTAAEVDLVCTNCHLWRPNEQLPRGARLLFYSMLSMLYSYCSMLYSMLPRGASLLLYSLLSTLCYALFSLLYALLYAAQEAAPLILPSSNSIPSP